MKILSIETSCDETGVSILEYSLESKNIKILGDTLASQIELHAQYGGVFPAMAKRAHAEKIIPLIIETLEQSSLLIEKKNKISTKDFEKISFLDEKEKDLKIVLVEYFQKYQKPDIDYIAVTVGPGLEPALWVGVNTARTLGTIWDIPVIPIDHMEGHLLTPILKRLDDKNFCFEDIHFPAISLLISGGHTELVLVETFGKYKKIGQTRDDAIGEAFDKVARMLGLPYPGGPAISKLAHKFRESLHAKNIENPFVLPRPMLNSKDYDFSFSGIKTAVLYTIRDLDNNVTDEEKEMIACEFEDAVTEVLLKKLLNAVDEYGAQSIIVGGGVASNTYIKKSIIEKINSINVNAQVYFPEQAMATDNAVMIGLVGILKLAIGWLEETETIPLKANGNLSISNIS